MKNNKFFLLFVSVLIGISISVSCTNSSPSGNSNVVTSAKDSDPKVEVVDENGKILYTTKYDDEGRLVEKAYYKNGNVIMTENNYSYNDDGRINSYRQVKADKTLTINYSYNELGNVLSRNIINNTRGNTVEKSMSIVYDDTNQKMLSSIEYDSSGETVKTTYVYDGKNILMGIVKELPDGNVIKYDYDYGDYNGTFYR